MKLKLLFFIILPCLMLLIAGCSNVSKKLVIGMVPYDSPNETINNFKPIKEYLQKEMNMTVDITVTKDYLGLIDAMKDEKVDIGFYGPFSYVAAENEIKLEPLVVQYRKETGTSYYSIIVAKKDSGIKSIEDLEGKKYAFVDPGSTSGYVIPYALFKSRDIDIQQYLSSTRFSGSHDSVALDVLNGIVDAGSMDDIVYNSMIESGRLKKDDFSIVWKSEAIPGSPYAARKGLDTKIKEKFKSAMIELHRKDPKSIELNDKNVEKYVECNSSTYNSIRNIATILGKDFIINKFLRSK